MPGGYDISMYDDLAAYYHLIFENWDASIARQASVLGPLIEAACGKTPVRILDAVCGIGKQAIGLAMRGHAVTGSDLSEAAVARARVETAARNLAIPLYAADLRDLSAVPGTTFDAVLIADNAFAHLPSEDDVRQAQPAPRANSIAAVSCSPPFAITTLWRANARPFTVPRSMKTAAGAGSCIRSGIGPASAAIRCTSTSRARLLRVGGAITSLRHFTPCRARW